jgi:hypothetical protein
MASVTSPSSNSSVQQQEQSDRLQLQQGFVALQSGEDEDDADDTDDLRPPPRSPRLSKSPRQESRQASYTNGSTSSNAAAAAAAQSGSYYGDERRSLQKATSSMAGINLDDTFDYEEEQDRMGTMSDLNLNLGRSSIDLPIDHSRQPSNMTSTMTSMSTLTGASPMSYVFSGSASGGRVSSGASSRESSPPTTSTSGGIAGSRQRQQMGNNNRGFSPSGKCLANRTIVTCAYSQLQCSMRRTSSCSYRNQQSVDIDWYILMCLFVGAVVHVSIHQAVQLYEFLAFIEACTW